MQDKEQRRATRLIRDYRTMTYEERLERCGLTTLDKRRRRGDLIETYTLMTNKEAIPISRFSCWPTEVDYVDTGIKSSGNRKAP